MTQGRKAVCCWNEDFFFPHIWTTEQSPRTCSPSRYTASLPPSLSQTHFLFLTHTLTHRAFFIPSALPAHIQSRPQSVKPINSEFCFTKTKKKTQAIHHFAGLVSFTHTEYTWINTDKTPTQKHTSVLSTSECFPRSWVKAISLDHPADWMTMQPFTEKQI